MKNKQKGFTVVELVIVIAVIAILSAILIPTFANLTKKANEVKLQDELRNVYVSYASNYEAEDENLYADSQVVITTYEVVITAPATTASVEVPTEGAANQAYMIDADGKWNPISETKTVGELNGGEAINGYYIYYIAA